MFSDGGFRDDADLSPSASWPRGSTVKEEGRNGRDDVKYEPAMPWGWSKQQQQQQHTPFFTSSNKSITTLSFHGTGRERGWTETSGTHHTSIYTSTRRQTTLSQLYGSPNASMAPWITRVAFSPNQSYHDLKLRFGNHSPPLERNQSHPLPNLIRPSFTTQKTGPAWGASLPPLFALLLRLGKEKGLHFCSQPPDQTRSMTSHWR